MYQSKLSIFTLTILLLAALPACTVGDPTGDDPIGDDSPDDNPDPQPDPDQPDPDQPVDQPDGCPELLSYDLQLRQGSAGFVSGDPEFVVLQADVQVENTEPLEVFVSMFNNQGLFASGYRTGTFPLTGIDTDPIDCSLCVVLLRRDADNQVDKLLIASAGSAEITSIDPPGGKLTGRIADAPMRQVDPQTGADVPGGCTTTLASYSFDADISPSP